MPGVVEEERALVAHDLELVTFGEDEAAVELADHVPREAHRPGEEDVDAARADELLAVDRLRLAGEQARPADAVTADVHERAAVQVGGEADVLDVAEAEAEGRADELERADRAALHELLRLGRLRVVPVHEGLHEKPIRPLGRREGALDLLGVPVEGLLAENMLPGFEREDRPLDVQRVRERDVDGVDVGVGEQPFVASVGALDPVLARVGIGPGLVTTGDRDDVHPVGLARAREDEPVDVRSRDDSPFRAHSTSKGLSAGYKER